MLLMSYVYVLEPLFSLSLHWLFSWIKTSIVASVKEELPKELVSAAPRAAEQAPFHLWLTTCLHLDYILLFFLIGAITGYILKRGFRFWNGLWTPVLDNLDIFNDPHGALQHEDQCYEEDPPDNYSWED